MWIADGNDVKNVSSITWGLWRQCVGNPCDACVSATLANVVHCGHHSALVLLEQDGAPLVATADRCQQPVDDKVHDGSRWDVVLEELLAMLLVALAVFRT